MDFEEFVKLMVAKNQFSFNEEEAKEAFRIFDRDCRGYVMSDELRQVFQTLEEKIPEHEINDMLQDQKHQFNRKITFDGNYNFINCSGSLHYGHLVNMVTALLGPPSCPSERLVCIHFLIRKPR